MIIVDNGHTLMDSTDKSVLKVLDFMQTNLSKENEKKNNSDSIESLNLAPCWQSRVVVFTANLLDDSRLNDCQLIEVDREFQRLKDVYVGNKVNQGKLFSINLNLH